MPSKESTPNSEPLFSLGQILATPSALKALAEAGQSPAELLSRHVVGEWGNLSAADQQANTLSLAQNLRLLSAYLLKTGVKGWVVTEADRSLTTLLLSEEY